MTDNTEPLKPTPEDFAGTVMPGGRGMEQHGVPLYGTPDLYDETSHGEDVEAHDIPEPPEPVDVRIVNTGAREFRRFRTSRFRVPATGGSLAGGLTPAQDVVQIAPRDDSRISLHIRNLSQDKGANVDRIFVAERRELCNKNDGYPIDPGESLVLSTQNEIYCITDVSASTSQQVAVLSEYAVKEV